MSPIVIATAIINWGALGKIIAAAFAAGAGVVIAFGFALLGLERAGQTQATGTRVLNYTITAAGGAFCLAAVGIGIWAMVQK